MLIFVFSVQDVLYLKPYLERVRMENNEKSEWNKQ